MNTPRLLPGLRWMRSFAFLFPATNRRAVCFRRVRKSSTKALLCSSEARLWASILRQDSWFFPSHVNSMLFRARINLDANVKFSLCLPCQTCLALVFARFPGASVCSPLCLIRSYVFFAHLLFLASPILNAGISSQNQGTWILPRRRFPRSLFIFLFSNSSLFKILAFSKKKQTPISKSLSWHHVPPLLAVSTT
jgi:hypothetical protein